MDKILISFLMCGHYLQWQTLPEIGAEIPNHSQPKIGHKTEVTAFYISLSAIESPPTSWCKMREIQIRPACIEDCSALARIVIDATQHAFEGKVPDDCLNSLTPEESARNWARNFEPGESLDQGVYLFVAEVDQKEVIGLAMAGATRKHHVSAPDILEQFPHELFTIQIDPTWQGKGVGRRLISQVADSLLLEGATRLLVKMHLDNPNQGFYERLGATRLGSQPHDWDGYVSEEILFGWHDIRKLSMIV